MTSKFIERARIAFGINPYDPSLPLRTSRSAALKSWHADWDAPTKAITYGGGHYKALPSAPTRPRQRIVPVFGRHQATNHRQNNSVVDLRADGDHIYAGEMPVLAIKAAGVDRYGFDLVELETSLATYLVNRSALKD